MQGFENRESCGQLRSGSIADFADGEIQTAAPAGICSPCLGVPELNGIFHGTVKGNFQPHSSSALVERKSTAATALSGMEFTLVPP